MKNTSIISIFSKYFALVLLICSCSETEQVITDNNTDSIHPYYNFTRAQEKYAINQSDFYCNIFKEIAKTKITDNFVISPFSLSESMAIALNGADGSTFSEIADVLGCGECGIEDINSYYSVLNDEMKESSFKIANAFWYSDSWKIKDDYILKLKDELRVPSYSVNMAGDKSKVVKTVNEWVRENTGGQIKTLINYLDPTTISIITNALYFRGVWLGSCTKEKSFFTNIKGKSSKIDFFTGMADATLTEYNIQNTDESEPSIIWLPYADNFKMMIMLPPANQSIRDFISSINESDFKRWSFFRQGSNTRDRITVHVPIFKIDTDLTNGECVNVLENLGIHKAFDPLHADFSKMSEGQLYIDQVLQKSTICVNESGTTASSASAITMNFLSGPQPSPFVEPLDFYVDRPFIYAITDSHGTMLYLGTYVK